MSSQENVSTFQESQKTPFNSEFFKDISPQKKTFEQKVENSQLIKPIPVNIKVLKRSKSDLTTMGDSTLTIKNVVKELKMPIMYQNYNYVNLVQNGLYNEDLYYKNNLENIDKGENNSSSYKKDKPFCYCTKTQCIKKYCECFANNKYCIDCHCQNCANKLIEINPLQKNMINVLENENETNKKGIDIHYDENEYAAFNNNIISAINENFQTSKSLIELDRKFYAFNKEMELEKKELVDDHDKVGPIISNMIKNESYKIDNPKERSIFLKRLKAYIKERFPYDFVYLGKKEMLSPIDEERKKIR